MILRRAVVAERLDYLQFITQRLDALRSVDRNRFLSSYEPQWTAERGLQLAAQAVVDIGTHILAGHFNEHPPDYEDVVRLLAVHDVLSGDLAARLRGLGGFTNILVHGYLTIDPERVYDFLQTDSRAFRDFAGEAAAWLQRYAG